MSCSPSNPGRLQECRRQGGAGRRSTGDALRACANGRKDDWGTQWPLAGFAISSAAAALGGEADDLTPSCPPVDFPVRK